MTDPTYEQSEIAKEQLSYPCDSHIELLWAQGDSDEAPGEVSLLLLQQVFALV